MTQASFFDEHDPSMAEMFWQFHNEHPEVYRGLVALGRQWLRETHRQRWSINGMFEVLRWQRHVYDKGDEPYKMNNNYRAFYARMMMRQHPEFEDMFEIRRQREDPDDAA